MNTLNQTTKPEFAVWIRDGLNGQPYVLADEMTREEADTLLDRIVIEPGGAAGVRQYLPGEWSESVLSR